jgi:hypothetical protein
MLAEGPRSHMQSSNEVSHVNPNGYYHVKREIGAFVLDSKLKYTRRYNLAV